VPVLSPVLSLCREDIQDLLLKWIRIKVERNEVA
jgi:hypothetical protein